MPDVSYYGAGNYGDDLYGESMYTKFASTVAVVFTLVAEKFNLTSAFAATIELVFNITATFNVGEIWLAVPDVQFDWGNTESDPGIWVPVVIPEL